MNERALVPRGVFKSYSVWAIFMFAFQTRFSLLLLTYYVSRSCLVSDSCTILMVPPFAQIPIYFQAVKNHTATDSGVDILAFSTFPLSPQPFLLILTLPLTLHSALNRLHRHHLRTNRRSNRSILAFLDRRTSLHRPRLRTPLHRRRTYSHGPNHWFPNSRRSRRRINDAEQSFRDSSRVQG